MPPPSPRIKGWCPGAWQPMASGDGLIVPFSHSVQEHPRAIVEIRRILHNQLLPSNAPSKP